MNARDRAHQPRELANGARALAQRLRSDEARDTVLQIAEAWDKLANDSESGQDAGGGAFGVWG